MKPTQRRQRTAKKLVLPLIASGVMATMMFMESASRRSHTPSSSAMSTAKPAQGASARVQHDVRQR
jgi:hypothetical protein